MAPAAAAAAGGPVPKRARKSKEEEDGEGSTYSGSDDDDGSNNNASQGRSPLPARSDLRGTDRRRTLAAVAAQVPAPAVSTSGRARE